MDFPEEIQKALKLLDEKLEKKSLSFTITVLGSMALFLNGYTFHRRTDLDIYNDTVPPEISELIDEISSELSLDKAWINNKASSISPLPFGFESRLSTLNDGYKNLKVYLLSTEDLIFLKVYALFSREAIKDLEDLQKLNPSPIQLDNAIKYIQEVISTHHGKMALNKSENDLIEFRKELNDKL